MILRDWRETRVGREWGMTLIRGKIQLLISASEGQRFWTKIKFSIGAIRQSKALVADIATDKWDGNCKAAVRKARGCLAGHSMRNPVGGLRYFSLCTRR